MADEIKSIRQMEDQVQKACSIAEVWVKAPEKIDPDKFKEELDLVLWHLQNAANIGEKMLKDRPHYVKA